MKKEESYRAYLQLKFDELPVQGRPTDDWRKLEKALNVAMPVAAFSIIIHGKAWLAKKIVWVCMLGLGAGGGTALVIYNLQQPGIQTAPTITRDTAVTRSDAKPQAKKKVLRPIVRKDTVARKHKKLPLLNTQKDTVAQKYKKLPPLYAPIDTVARKYKKLPPPYALKDTVGRKYKKLPPPYALKDTVGRNYKKSPPPYAPKIRQSVSDTTVKKHKKETSFGIK